MQPLLEAPWKSDKGWTRAELVVRQRDKSRLRLIRLCPGSVNKREMQRDFTPEVLQRLCQFRGEANIFFLLLHTHKNAPPHETAFIFMTFLSLQHITLSTHSTLSGDRTRVQNISGWSVSLPCLHGKQWEHRGGWGSLLTPKVWPKRAKPPVLVEGAPLGEDRGAGAKRPLCWVLVNSCFFLGWFSFVFLPS